MCQAGNTIQFRLTIREDIMEKENAGVMETYTWENTRMAKELKEKNIFCREILLTLLTMSSMMQKGIRLRIKK